jgi:hypothetical protein
VRKGKIEIQRAIRLLNAHLIDNHGRPKTFKLKFGYEPDRYYNVRYSGQIPVERLFGRIGKAANPLICFEGLAYSVAKNHEVTWGITIISFASDFLMGHTGSGAVEIRSNTSTIVSLTGVNLRPIIIVSGSGLVNIGDLIISRMNLKSVKPLADSNVEYDY